MNVDLPLNHGTDQKFIIMEILRSRDFIKVKGKFVPVLN
jgi:hypothetical protein